MNSDEEGTSKRGSELKLQILRRLRSRALSIFKQSSLQATNGAISTKLKQIWLCCPSYDSLIRAKSTF